MTAQTKRSMTFASRSAQNRPFRIADRVFWSKRLLGDDELAVTEHQALSRLEPRRSVNLLNESALIARLLDYRRRDDEQITPEWVRAHVGESSALTLFTYLRTGEGLPPGDTLDLRVFDEPIVIDERAFTPRGLNYAEQIHGAQLVEQALPDTVKDRPDTAALDEPEPEVKTWGEARAVVEKSLSEGRQAMASSTTALAGYLNARITDGQPPIDSDWLLQRVTMEEVGIIVPYLASGIIPEVAAETPNADATGPAPSA